MTIIRDDATEAQVRAAEPFGSTWLGANAGSGKTRVLTDRVARLLLRNVDPQQILCLTYTKAAASEMQNRLFKRLGEWAMSADHSLRETLQQLGEENHVSDVDLTRARTLFARAIETPGGLKIQTIHSFCSSLLRRFPLEAGVNPQFQEMEERAAELLRAEIVDDMARGEQFDVVRNLAQFVTGEDFGKLTGEIVRRQERLTKTPSWDEVAATFGVSTSLGPMEIEAALYVGGERDVLDQLIPAMLKSGSKDQEIAKKLQSITALDANALPILCSALLTTTASTPLQKNPNKGVKDAFPEEAAALAEFMERIAAAVRMQWTYDGARKTFALYQFAGPFLHLYHQAKRVRGWLDFDDLILLTRRLLTDPKVAAWVLYRLDGGLRHILVDEAQDTSPAQWDVIRKLAEEFTSGQGTQDDEARTIFVVGDKKQSIYSFQGADPAEFDSMGDEFASKLDAIGQTLARLPLDYSFRSSHAILRLVDSCFEDKQDAGFVPGQMHIAFHEDKPGRVDLWPFLEKADVPEKPPWYDPVDRRPDTHHDVVLAHAIADQIATMLDDNDPALIPERGKDSRTYTLRRVRAGDVMVLVQRRSALFHEIIRACKQRGLPIAGADRLRVGGELAVRDLLALLSFLATPEDSLSLATVLRSPLCGWSEKELFQLAHGRAETHLWESLRNARDAHADTYAMLEDLRGRIDFLRPYDLLERILTRYRGRAKLLSRLGQEAEDGIDAILSQALAYERTTIPSLTGFLIWAKADDLEIKRQIDASGDLIRVMTVHGAKGLEAPIVILPDSAKRRKDIKDELLESDSLVVWKTRSDESPELVQEALDARKDAEARERLRLLYVALTRAETWLIVAAAGELSKNADDWYQIVEAGLKQQAVSEEIFPVGPGLRYEYGQWDLPIAPQKDAAPAPAMTLEAALLEPITSIPDREDPLSPSSLAGAKALASDTGLPEDVAKARGTYVHTLLEVAAGLAPEKRELGMLGVPVPAELNEGLAQTAQEEAIRTLNEDHLSWVFAAEALAEVPFHAQIRGKPMKGIIDRLIVHPDEVTIIDFKTNMAVPLTPEECPAGILAQMGAYLDAIAQIFPDKAVNLGILWTATSTYMSLPQNLVIDALTAAIKLDGAETHT